MINFSSPRSERSIPVVYDILRLILAASTHNPRGIDRVDLAYARFLFECWPDDCFGILPTPWGIRLYDRRRVLLWLDRLELLWHEHVDANSDIAYATLLSELAGRPAAAGRGVSYEVKKPIGLKRFVISLANGFSFGASAVRNAPPGALYLNVGQLGWAAAWTSRWLLKRPDVRALFMLHDVIPLERPDLVSWLGTLTHKSILRTAARRASGLILTTRAASDSILQALQAAGLPTPRSETMALPVAPAFLRQEPVDAISTQYPYFVICGAIERRKNHLMLLDVWRKLALARGALTPTLVIVGSPAHDGASVLNEIESATRNGVPILIASRLSSPGLRRVVANARALLMPSLAEGFGLPILEAMTLKTPVIASDLPAHREVGGELVSYLSPSDSSSWFQEISHFTDDDAYVAMRREQLAGYRPMTEQQYFDRVSCFLMSFA